MDYSRKQAHVARWLEQNVPGTNLHERLAALCEETGEVARCITKMRPHLEGASFRGTKEEWMVRLHEELGDVINCVIGMCVVADFDFQAVMASGLRKLDGIDLANDPLQHGMETSG